MIVVAAISKAVMDKIQFHYNNSIFNDKVKFKEMFWNPKISWKNKWKFNEETRELEERFSFSSTILVGFTDAWHRFQSILYCLVFGVIVLRPDFSDYIVVNFAVIYAVFTGTFELFFRYILEKK